MSKNRRKTNKDKRTTRVVDGFEELMPRFGADASLGDAIQIIKRYLQMISCEDGLRVLEKIEESIKEGECKDELIEELIFQCDRLPDRFKLNGMIKESFDLWYDYMTSSDRIVPVQIQVPKDTHGNWLPVLLNVLTTWNSNDVGKKERLVVFSTLYLSGLGMMYKSESKRLSLLDYLFEVQVHEGGHSVLEDIRHSAAHNNVWVTDTSVSF